MKRAVILFLIAIVLICELGFSQGSGRVRGRVLDQATGEPLPGANVIVLATSLGTATDLNGDFVLNYVPVGKVQIRISYVGYDAVIKEVTVSENSVVQLEVKLAPQAIMGEEVVVTAQVRGQQAAINQQISSSTVVNIVSEDRIQELPDFNAAQAIGRLPGISTLQSSGEANKIVIRGLAPQYNAVAVGGVKLASTGSTQIGATSTYVGAGTVNTDRSVDLSMVTPYMIRTIEVHKTFTPDMEANALGGFVNMELREAPEGFRSDALIQSGYTDKSGKYGNYRVVLSMSNRFFDDALGVYVLGNAESYDRDADRMNAGYVTASSTLNNKGYRAVRVTTVSLVRHFEIRKRYGGNVILDYRLPHGSIRSVNMFSRLNSIYQDYTTSINYGSTNYDIGFTYRDGDRKTDVAMNSLEFKKDFHYFQLNVTVANTYSRNYEPNSPRFAFFQNDAISRTHSVTGDTNIVPENLTRFINYRGDSLVLLGSSYLFFAQYKQNAQSYKADIKVPLNFGTYISGAFKIGGMYKYSLHRNDQNAPYINIRRGTTSSGDINQVVIDSLSQYFPNLAFGPTNQLLGVNFTSKSQKLYKSFLDNKFGEIYWACDPTKLKAMIDYISSNSSLHAYNSVGGWFTGPFQQLVNDYKYVEKYYAAYLMADYNIGSRFSIVGGVRYEEDKGIYDVNNMMDERNPATQQVFKKSALIGSRFLLPMVQTKYNIADWLDVRCSYSQTIARPDYTQCSPHFNISADSPRTIWAGNPKLKPAQSDNYDALISFHSNELGLLSIGGFYKEIKNFTYYTSYQLYSKTIYDRFGIKGLDSLNSYAPFLTNANAGSTLNTYINSRYKAYVKGIEFELQTNFWYLPVPFNGIVIGANYTHVWSDTKYPYFDVKASRGQIVWYTDSTRTGRLVFQPNDIFNAYVGYDYKGFSARVSCVFQGNQVTYVGAYPEQDGYSKDYFRVDFSARQILPWWGIQIFFDANNLNSAVNKSAQRSIDGFTSQEFYGLTANLGMRITIN